VSDRLFGTLFWGKMLGALGVWVHIVVAAVVTYDATRSATAVGAVSMLQFGPQILLAPFSGKLTDHGHGASQILAGRLLCAAGSGGIAVWLALSPSRPGSTDAIAVMAGSLVVGIGFVAGGPAMQAIVPSIIRPGELSRAMALNTLPLTFSRAAGPALGALLVATLDPVAAFTVAAATHLVFALLLTLTRLPHPESAPAGTDLSVRAAMSYVGSDRPVLLSLLGVAAVGFGTEPATTLAPPLAHSLGSGTTLVGWLASSFGVGAGVGLLAVTALPTLLRVQRQGCVGLVVMTAGLLGAAGSASPSAALLSFGLCGIGLTLAMTGLSTLLQDRVPAHLRGRIMALWLIGFLGSRPPAAAVDGVLADLVSVQAALIVTALVVGSVAWLVRPSRVDPREGGSGVVPPRFAARRRTLDPVTMARDEVPEAGPYA
jgi:MFS family permease